MSAAQLQPQILRPQPPVPVQAPPPHRPYIMPHGYQPPPPPSAQPAHMPQPWPQQCVPAAMPMINNGAYALPAPVFYQAPIPPPQRSSANFPQMEDLPAGQPPNEHAFAPIPKLLPAVPQETLSAAQLQRQILMQEQAQLERFMPQGIFLQAPPPLPPLPSSANFPQMVDLPRGHAPMQHAFPRIQPPRKPPPPAPQRVVLPVFAQPAQSARDLQPPPQQYTPGDNPFG